MKDKNKNVDVGKQKVNDVSPQNIKKKKVPDVFQGSEDPRYISEKGPGSKGSIVFFKS